MAGVPYQGGLQTDFNPNYTYQDTNLGGGRRIRTPNYGVANPSGDADVAGAQQMTNEMEAARRGENQGVDFATNQAKLDLYRSRIGIKNSLAERIARGGQDLESEKDDINAVGAQALDSGTRNTRRNYNSRGLLYSGMREGGEQSVRGAVSSQLARGMAGAERDVRGSTDAAKAAYASVGLANQQENLKQANAAFDTAHANNIARLQAMQQLGQGVGYAGGMAYGSLSNPSNPAASTSMKNEFWSQPSYQMGQQSSPPGWNLPPSWVASPGYSGGGNE